MFTNLDSTVIVAIIGLFGTIYTVRTNSLLELNKQLFEMVEQQNELLDNQKEEIIKLRQQHQAETEALSYKIGILTSENNSLRQEIMKLQDALSKLKTN